jgi:hypothetical protein
MYQKKDTKIIFILPTTIYKNNFLWSKQTKKILTHKLISIPTNKYQLKKQLNNTVWRTTVDKNLQFKYKTKVVSLFNISSIQFCIDTLRANTKIKNNNKVNMIIDIVCNAKKVYTYQNLSYLYHYMYVLTEITSYTKNGIFSNRQLDIEDLLMSKYIKKTHIKIKIICILRSLIYKKISMWRNKLKK